MHGKLLRFLQSSEVQKLGSLQTNKVDVRIISATNADLSKLINLGRFREDLFYRLNVVSFFIPPLRDRKEDIPVLVEYFINEYIKRQNYSVKTLSGDALNKLLSYEYPGNVRELQNIIQNALLFSNHDVLAAEDFSFPTQQVLPEEKTSAPIPTTSIDNQPHAATDFIYCLHENLDLLNPEEHLKVLGNQILINPRTCFQLLENQDVFLKRKEVLRYLKQCRYFKTNEGQAYFNGRNSRVWVLDRQALKLALRIEF